MNRRRRGGRQWFVGSSEGSGGSLDGGLELWERLGPLGRDITAELWEIT